LGFIIPNREQSRPLQDFTVPIDQIEKRTGIDFFEKMDEKEQAKIEGGVYSQHWKF
jgi:endonuclease G